MCRLSSGLRTTDLDGGLHGFGQPRHFPKRSRPAEQVFAVEEDSESEDTFAMVDRPLWTGLSNIDSTVPPTLQQMFALAQKMGYEMRPIARQLDNMRQPSGSPRAPYTPNSGLFVIIPGSSVSAVGNLDTLRPLPEA